MTDDWRSFVAGDTTCLIRTSFTDEGYKVFASDLTHVWAETLDKDGIHQRAREVKSPIRPEEGFAQLQILLQKLESCLRGENGTVTPLSGSSCQDDFTFTLCIPLPKPFGNLDWQIHFKRISSSGMKSELLSPLVALAYSQQQQIVTLSRLLAEKDHAVSRILDKIESQNLDFGSIFPTVRLTKRGNQREQVVKGIKGLAPFDRNRWLDNVEHASADETDATTLLSGALSGSASNQVLQLARKLDTSVGITMMGEASVRPVHMIVHPEKAPVNGHREALLDKDETSPEAGDEFQRQSTPKRRRGLASSQTSDFLNVNTERQEAPFAVNPEDESTEDEDDLDAPPRLKLGHQSSQTSRLSHEESIDPCTSQGLSRDPAPQVETASASSPLANPMEQATLESKQSTPPSPPRPAATPSRTSKTSRKLGKIGSRNHEPAPSRSSTASPPPTNKTVPAEQGEILLTRPTSRKLGKIGRQRPVSEASAPEAPTAGQQIPGTSESVPKRKLGKLKGNRLVHVEPSTSADPTCQAKQGSTALQNDMGEDVVPSIESTSRFIAPDVAEPPKEPEQEETAEEKADRRREDLKRKMEATKPVEKKKRRF